MDNTGCTDTDNMHRSIFVIEPISCWTFLWEIYSQDCKQKTALGGILLSSQTSPDKPCSSHDNTKQEQKTGGKR